MTTCGFESPAVAGYIGEVLLIFCLLVTCVTGNRQLSGDMASMDLGTEPPDR